jgi:fluoroquinolone resistance protein
VAQVADRKHGIPAPATTSTVRSADWDGRDLSGERHEKVAFIDVDLSETVDDGGVFTECAFRGARFNVSRHANAAFVNCTFTRCSFFDATFAGCKLVGSMFDGCTFGLLEVDGGDWSFTGLPGADLRRSLFRGVRMREADLTGARFDDARLLRCDLSGAWLHSASFTGCDLRGSDLSAFDPETAELKGAVIDPAQALVIAAALGLVVREG